MSYELAESFTRTTWALAWSSALEEADLQLPDGDLVELAPEVPAKVRHMCDSYLSRLLIQYPRIARLDDQDRVGYCLAMETAGTGVGLGDDGRQYLDEMFDLPRFNHDSVYLDAANHVEEHGNG